MITTVQSEYGTLKKVFIKSPEAAFQSQPLLDNQWKDLNYIERPDYEKSKIEYASFESILKAQHVDISYFSKDQKVTIDSIYCRDASIVTDYGVILCNMGKPQRRPESVACKKDYVKNDYKILAEITTPGIIEGGDVAWLDPQTLAVAHGYRTNDAGYNQLKEVLTQFDIEVIQVDLPHYKGQSDVFHLMSIFSPVDKHLAVVYSPLIPVRFRNLLLERGYQLIEVPDSEFESMGCNVLAIAPSKCMMVAGNPVTKGRLEMAGCIVTEYQGNEISIKGGGGPTCLTRPLLREIPFRVN